LKKHQNCISHDLQDLVGSLLVDEDNRPVPDQIVSHSFFKMHWVPERLSSSWTAIAPTFPNNTPPAAAEISQGYSFSWYQACRKSGVGEYSPGCTFPVVGLGNIASIFKDIEKEIKAGRAPTVPIAATKVYLPFISEQKEKTLNRSRHIREVVEDHSSSQSSHLAEISGNNADTMTRMLPIRRAPSRRYKENMDPELIRAVQVESKPAAPVRPRVASGTQKEKAPIKTQVYLQATVESRPQISRERTKSTAQLPRQRSVRQKDATQQVTQPLAQPAPQEKTVETASQPQDRNETFDIVSQNNPASVLQRATRLRDQLLFALQPKTRPPRTETKKQSLPFVSKWVDYAKKHGVGYVLSDGTIGCAFNATSRQSVMHVVVRNGRAYLENNKTNQKPTERIPLQFFSVDGEGGLHASNPEGDLWRRNAVLWTKFGRYMCQTLSTGNERKPSSEKSSDGAIVRYYQRIGPVGMWTFTDGSVQVSRSGSIYSELKTNIS
jgi:myosin-1